MTIPAHLLADQLVGGDGVLLARPSPIDGSPLPEARLFSAKVADRAVSAARFAERAAADLTVEKRAAALRWIARTLSADSKAIAHAVTLETGCPVDQSEALQVASAASLLDAYADLAESHIFEESRAGFRGGDVVVRKHPVGVAVGIVPWNVPVFLACMKLGPAVAAGCPVILKPSPENVASMARFAAILANSPLPVGMVQLVTGERDLGEALVNHRDVAKVSFTGSVAAGRIVGAACAERLARCTLELGGKSAAVLLDDVDFDAVQDQLFLAMLQNNGQVCGAQSRVLVPRARFAELTDCLANLFRRLNVGDPREAGVDIGPVATPQQASRIRGLIERAFDDGATAIASASIADGDGAYISPTLLRTEDATIEIAREEVFGPVTVVLPYGDEEEAVALANDSPYGLSGSVWTADIERAVSLARRLRTGSIGINSKKILDFGAPFGGFRSSGMGRELGPEGIDAYLEASSILAPSTPWKKDGPLLSV